MPEAVWVRDLLKEGVEPNPGPGSNGTQSTAVFRSSLPGTTWLDIARDEIISNAVASSTGNAYKGGWQRWVWWTRARGVSPYLTASQTDQRARQLEDQTIADSKIRLSLILSFPCTNVTTTPSPLSKQRVRPYDLSIYVWVYEMPLKTDPYFRW
jgi:hypothetical protein